jgi:hypothetical protein
MVTFLSAVTSVKDYVDVVHALMYHDPMWSEVMTSYVDPGAILTYSLLFCKELLIKLFTFGWLPNFPSLPSLIPEVTRSMLTELSVFDTPALRFPNMFTFLETPISYGPQNIVFYSLEKFIIGLFNSLFFCLPTSLAHIICMRRFVMQGVDAGYLAGLGTIAGNLVWISCIVLGFRWVVIPWIHLDMLRYAVGTAIVLKYLWDSYRDRRVVLTAVDEYKAFMFNFVLSFLEQSMVFPFIGNLSIGSDSTLIESFPTDHVVSFFLVHFAYLGGLLVGSLTLLQAACWFWEEPAFRFYMWAMSTFKISTLTYYNICNFFFLYASMFFAMANLAYFGTDYLLTKPLGYVPQDRLLRSLEIVVQETSYLGVKSSSRNTRINEGRHTRRERWKKRHKKFRAFDSALYDDGIYDLFTVEDLNYGFHRFWLRRKMRTHKGNYRLLPGKRVRKYKADIARTKLENFMGPRFEFTRMLFETVYTPTFHQYQTNQQPKKKTSSIIKPFNVLTGNQVISAYTTDKKIQVTDNLRHNNSALRKFVRKVKLRLKGSDMEDRGSKVLQSKNPLYSKRWRHLFSRIYHRQLRRNTSVTQLEARQGMLFGEGTHDKYEALVPLSDRDRQLTRYKSYIKQSKTINKSILGKPNAPPDASVRAVHPLSFYLKREDALKRKFEAYGPTVTRANALGTNLHVFTPLTRRLFYYPKSTERWERAMQVARLTRKRTRESRLQEIFVEDETKPQSIAGVDSALARIRENPRGLTYSTDYWALITKRGQRLRHQIFKDVLQHWYYNPYNRFLVQWDMDSFIRRQPRSYFVNKEDQKQLHLRRVLLNDYFQTFRWYARMDQYHTMKQRIGGTKSFSSRVYNQQFQGTFKRVRHLFAVTPTLETQPILKFDQPLFNEYPNTTKNPVTAQSFIHEELNYEPKTTRGLSRELWDQTAAAVALALTTQAPARKNYLDDKFDIYDPGKTTRFLLRGKKTRGIEASSGSRRHLNEEATALKIRARPLPKFDPRPYVDDLWLRLLERAADFIYDDDALKYAIEDFADDTYADEIQQDKVLKRKMERLQQWAVFMNTTDPTNPDQGNLLGGLTRASSEVIKDALYFQNDIRRQNVNRRKTRPVYPDRYNQLTTVKKVLKRRYQQRFLDQLKAEENVYDKTKDANLLHSRTGPRGWLMDYVLRPLKTVVLEVNDRVVAPMFFFVTKPLRAPEDPDFYYWGKREEAYEIESDVELELDPLRRRFRRKPDKPNLRGTYPFTRKFDEETRAKYKKLLEEEIPDKVMAFIPRQKQGENAMNLKLVRVFAEGYRQQQIDDLRFLYKAIKKEANEAMKGDYDAATREFEAQFRTWQENQELLPERVQQRKDRAEIDRIIQLERQGKMKEADILRITRSRRIIAKQEDQERLETLEKRLDEGTLVEPQVPLKVGRQIRLLGDHFWWPRGETPPEGETFELQVPYTVYRTWGDLTEKRDMYDLRRSKRAKRYRKWDRERNRREEREEAMDTTEEPETFLNRIGEFFMGPELDEEPQGNAVPLEFEYPTMSLVDPNDEYDEERNEAMFELLDEYTPLRDDPESRQKARDMQEQILRTLRKKPNLKLEDRFKPLTDEPTEYDVDELNWWGQQKWPIAVELEEGMYFRQITSQTEFESIAADAYREAKRNQLHRWWWQEFIPQVRNQNNDQVYGRQDRDLNKALKMAGNNNSLEELGKHEEEDGRTAEVNQPQAVGDRDYKPLQTPQGANTLSDVIARDYEPYEALHDEKRVVSGTPRDYGPLNKVTHEKLEVSPKFATNPNQWVTSNPSPFYVGWDETARQFMVTNRYLSREESGYQMNWNDNFPILNGERDLSPDAGDTLTFSKYPFKGLTANPTVYNKVLFASYEADQFFNLGLDGFTPVGWRKFKFRHSAPRVQPLLVHSVETSNLFRIFDTKRPYANLVQRYVSPHLASDSNGLRLLEKADQGDDYREIFKDVEAIQKHPQVPVYFPHGPLLRDVLPVYYVFSLYQRYRLPKDRYVDVAEKDGTEEPEVEEFDENGEEKPREIEIPTLFPDGKMEDFTLRKRALPDRAYHAKDQPLNEDELLPFRKPFFGRRGQPPTRPGRLTEANFPDRLREANEMRVRTLRRRVLRKTVRPQLRYPPAVGGFVWPGEALHLELVEGNLVPPPEVLEQIKMKQRAIEEGREVPTNVSVAPEPVKAPIWTPQAVNYFIDTHNRKVLQRRLERTQNKAYAYQKLKFMRLNADPFII